MTGTDTHTPATHRARYTAPNALVYLESPQRQPHRGIAHGHASVVTAHVVTTCHTPTPRARAHSVVRPTSRTRVRGGLVAREGAARWRARGAQQHAPPKAVRLCRDLLTRDVRMCLQVVKPYSAAGLGPVFIVLLWRCSTHVPPRLFIGFLHVVTCMSASPSPRSRFTYE